MNKYKLSFIVIGVIILIFTIYVIGNLNNKPTNTRTVNSSESFNIWMIGEQGDSVTKIIENFKKVNPKYSSQFINIEVFSSFDDYTYALMSAITSGKAPDIFVLNSSEKTSVFYEQILGIDPSIINPNDFRKKYRGVFSQDLIVSIGKNKEKQEFLIGVPVGYESLGIFYNRRYIKNSELKSISGLNNVIAKLKNSKPNLIPIGIGNGSTVEYSSDIVTQFFMLEDGVSGLADLVGNKLKQGIATYLLYGDIDGYNGFNSRFKELNTLGKSSIDLFSAGETFMVVGYPRLLNKIIDKGFSKNVLLATPFPHYFSGNGKTLVNYDYFVINKDSKNIDLGNSFLSYLSSDIGAKNFLDSIPYLLPALLSLESDVLEKKINEKYNIILDDFINLDYELGSFDKGIKNLYDKNIISILDNSSTYIQVFDTFQKQILCKATKIATLENLSDSCD